MDIEAKSECAPRSRRRFIGEKGLFSNEIVLKSLVVLADQGSFTATNFLTGVIIARICGKESLGFYALGWCLILLTIQLQSSLILSPYTAFGPRLSDGEHRLYLGSTMIHQISLAMLSAVTLFGIAFFLLLGGASQKLAYAIWALALVIPFILFRQYARQVCIARLDVNAAFLIDLGVALIQIVGLLVLVYTRTLFVNNAFYMVGCACAVPSVTWLVLVRHHFSLRIGQLLSDLKQNLAFGKWVLGGNLSELISNQLYPWLVTMFYGIEMTGALAACMGVIGIFNPIRVGIGNIVGPRSAHAYAKSGIRGLNSIVLAATIFLATASGLFCLSIFFWGDDFVRLLYGSAFAGNRMVVSILSLAVLASALSSGIDYGLWAVGKADKNFRANLFSLGITITLGAFLVKITGLLGVGVGMLVANGGASMIRYVFYKRMKRALNEMPADCGQRRIS